MWVCRRSPRRRASAADSFISSVVTLNGEQGATAIRSSEDGEGSWNRATASSVSDRIASRSWITESGGRPPSDWPRSIDPLHGWNRIPTSRADSISAARRSPAPAGNT